MKRISGSKRSTTRFIVESDPHAISKESLNFEIRSSHRRSSADKAVIPKLSIGRVHSHAPPTINFQVEKGRDTGKTPKQTFSKLLQGGNKLSFHDIRKSLNAKSRSMVLEYGLVPETCSQWKSEDVTRFTGEMWQHGSSRVTDTAINIPTEETCEVLWSEANSRAVLCGDLSLAALEDLWPWPWLSPDLNTLDYVSNEVRPTTFSFQEQLHVYPLLPLSHTLQSYIRSVKLLVRPERLRHIEKLLNNFEKTSGQGFQNDIIREFSTVNLSDDSMSMYWLPRLVPSVTQCLTRLEAPLANSAILFSAMWDLWPAREDSQIERAIVIIELVAEFARLVYSERLSVFKDDSGFPLCNHQFRKLFSSSKIPGIPSDATHCFFKTIYEPLKRSTPKHIVVVCRGQMFRLEIILDDFSTVTTQELRESLMEIVTTAEENSSTSVSGVGILTSIDRDEWSETRVHLMTLSENNRDCLQTLEECMFVLTLEHMKSRGTDRLVNEAVFADGCNRWYDKGLSFYMYQNGLLTVNVCSSIVDNSVVNTLLRFIHIRILEDAERWDDEVYRKSGRVSRCVSMEGLFHAKTLSQISELVLVQEEHSELDVPSASQSCTTHLRPLIFDLDDSLVKRILDAEMSFDCLSENLSSSLCQFQGFEIDLLEDRKINIDAFAHLALQLTFLKMYFRPPAVGSKVSIRRFYHAHFETMITTTAESLAWCNEMLKPDASVADKKRLFLEAAKKHAQQLEEVRSGLGCFHHLSALREIAAAAGDHSSVATLDTLSEQPAGSPESLDISCEGCETHDCLSVAVVVPPSVSSYGVGYVLAKSRALFSVCSWKSCPSTCAENFSWSLHTCLEQLQKLLYQS
ncbi:carnitine O-octanoyltransferase [Elysia marginata]|uniref:Carnitine O-octanoyltransferase n=1 Tax=Elysia marginata TaxID=1093978 RepID=A0AAV4GM95_9GAST|nr:carnitine O-octanoyltransferase [Elysia marginata]